MSVAAATSSAVSTQHHHQPTPEQLRLAQLIDDKKHDQPEVQDIVRKVLDVVANSTQEEALVALYDCDYDYERAVALLIEKGHDIANEWRTATNHKTTKKQQQQQQKTASMKNGHEGETDENAQTRNNDGFTYRGKSRNGRSRFQQQNGGDSQNNQQKNDNYVPQQRQRGGSNYRGRFRGNNRGGQRTNERNYQQQQLQDSNVDTSLPSDTTQRLTEVSYTNRPEGGGNNRQQESQPWDVGNWNGETLIYSRSSKDEEQTANSVNNNVSNTSNAPAGVSNGQYSSLETSNVNNVSERNTQQQSKTNFDPVEAARHIKNVIGIGQTQPQQQKNVPPSQPLMDIKPLMGGQQAGQQQKTNVMTSKPTGQNFHTKVTPPPQRIPHQPVIFSDRFDGGMNKIDVQFGNLNETFDDTSMQNPSISIPSSSSSAFYQRSEPTLSGTKSNTSVPLGVNSQRSTEPSAFVSPTMHTNATRSTEQQSQVPMMNQPRVLPQQIPQQQQPSMTMKPVVPPAFAVHHQQHAINAQNLLLHPLVFHQQQQETVPLDASFDPTVFQLPSIDLTSPYFMAAMNQQPQQTQARFLVTQPPPQQQQQQQNLSNRQPSSTNVQTPSLSSSSTSVPPSSTSTTSATAPKKGPAVPPGIFLPTAPQTQQAYSTNYGVPLSVGRQQQTGATNYSYDTEHLFTNAYMQLTNPQQAQSPSGAYGSVTPPVQQSNQQQQTHTANDNKGLSYPNQFHENLLLLQQFQQIHIPQSNSQQQTQQATHSPAQLNFFLSHPGSGPNYSQGPSVMYAQPPTAMAQHQQQVAKQQYNHNNSSSSSGIVGNDDYYGRNSSSSTKDAQYMYNVSGQPQQVSSQSTGQQQNVNKQQQQQQRTGGNVYNNQTNSQRSYQ